MAERTLSLPLGASAKSGEPTMSSAPPLFSAIIVAFVCCIIAGRWLLVDETLADRLINRTLTWDVAAVFGYVAAASAGQRDLGPRLYLGVGLLALANGLGLAELMVRADPERARRRQRRYDAIAATVGGCVVIGAVAESAGLGLSRTVDWVSMVWSASILVIGWVGVLLMWACVRELRTAASTWREKSTYSAVFIVGLYCTVSPIQAVQLAASGRSLEHPGIVWAVGSFIAMAAIAALVSIPLINALMVQAGLDRAGRHCRRLRPLWSDLTTAVPAVVLSGDREDPRSRLYRMTIEIGDALVHLRQFVPDTDAHRVDSIRAYAVRIASAVELKLAGEPGCYRSGLSRGNIQPPAEDRGTELRNLLALAREWSRAKAAVVDARRAD